MKQLILLLLTALAVFSHKPAAAQAVLNEIYTDPGSGNHEFFELYNTSISGKPVSMDNYSLVAYYENSPTDKGFYVLDFPNMFVGPKGYFTGAAQMPFNYQGNTASKAADFNWNDPQLASNFGYLKKYTLTVDANLPDHLKTYTASNVTNLNDLFYKRMGNGAAYSIMVYQNGKLVNLFFGGTGGAKAVPPHILAMPPLEVAIVTKDTTSAFTVDFKSFSNKTIEGVVENAGSDNGFIRTRDGLCNYWGKSSANVKHTPDASNGKGAGIVGSLSITSHLYPGASPADSAFISYNIVSGPIELFPVNLQVYLDNGVTDGQLDSADVFVGQNTETTFVDGGFQTKYMPPTQDLLLIAETSIGCLDQIIHLVPPEKIAYTTLPVNITAFKATKTTQHNKVEWTVEENKAVKNFEVQKSYDGVRFTSVGTVAGTANNNIEAYTYKTATEGSEKLYFRLKLVEKNNSISYSKVVLAITENNDPPTTLSLLQNPVNHQLVLQYTAMKEEAATFLVYNIAGIAVKKEKRTSNKGNNQITIGVDALPRGTYIVHLSGTQQVRTTKFIKQ